MGQSLYDHLGKNDSRSYFINVTEKNVEDSDVSVKISTFSGRLNVTFYQDEKLKKPILGGQFSNHGELQFRFPRKHLQTQNVTEKLYIVVKSPESESTYVLSSFLNDDSITKLGNDIFEMVELEETDITNFYVDVYKRANDTNPKEIKFSIHNLVGKVRPYISLCR